METLIEIVGTILIELLQEIWPPILAILNGALILFLGFASYLFFTTDQPFRTIGSMVAAALFLVVFIVCFKTGVYAKRTTTKRRDNRRK